MILLIFMVKIFVLVYCYRKTDVYENINKFIKFYSQYTMEKILN